MKYSLFSLQTLLMTLLVSLFAFSLVSCSDDDDPVPDYADYYITCTKVSGGGFSSQECASLQNSLNEDLVDLTLKGKKKGEAIEVFDDLVSTLAKELSSLKPKEALTLTFTLKTTEGSTVKSSAIILTQQGSTIK